MNGCFLKFTPVIQYVLTPASAVGANEENYPSSGLTHEGIEYSVLTNDFVVNLTNIGLYGSQAV